MNKSIILNLLVCCGFTHGKAFVCPEVDGICVVGQFPDPDSCAYYHVCTLGEPLGCLKEKLKCPELWAFDKYTSTCVLAIDAACDGKFNVFTRLNVSLCSLFHK